MRKFLGPIPLYVSSDFIGFTNEFGQYETIADASDLGLRPCEQPYYIVDFEAGETMSILQSTTIQEDGGFLALKSTRTGECRLYHLQEASGTAWCFRSVSRLPNGEYGLLKIFND